VHKFELLRAPVEVLDPQEVPHPRGALQHRAEHRQVRALGRLPVSTAVAPRPHRAIAWLDGALSRDPRHSSNMVVA
jgi:hypothetical protein